MRPSRVLVPPALAAALLLAACGRADEPALQGSPSQTATPPSPTPSPTDTGPALPSPVQDHGTSDLTGQGTSIEFSIEADDVYFEPTFVEVRAGASVNLEVENEGGLPHTFTIDALNVDVQVDGGQRQETTFTLPGSGDVVVFYCRFHRSQGMQGAFVLQS